MNAAHYERCRAQTKGITPRDFIHQAICNNFGEGAQYGGSSLETCAQSGAFYSVVHHVRHRAISVISELKAIWTHSPPKLD